MSRKTPAFKACMLACVASGLILTSASTASAADSLADSLSVSGSIAFTTDYTYRGLTQNYEHPTPQLGVEVSHTSGLYAGVWGSLVDFNDDNQAKSEVDLSGGYRYENGPWSGDVRYTHFIYPSASPTLNYNYGEFSFSGAYDFGLAAVGGAFAYSPEFFANSGSAEYVQAKLDVPLPSDFAAHAYLGKQFVEDNVAFGYPDTVDWNIGASYTYEKLLFDLSYIDTNLSKAECEDGCEARIVGTVTYTF